VLVPLLASAFASLTRTDAIARLQEAGVPCAPIRTVPEALADPQTDALGAVVRIPHPTVGDLPLVRWPFELAETPATLRRHPPRLGEHTEEVLRELS
jgi:crotonobetainyl-CoA:carnitine CoA-transferase CaiB-like acyl-CoA transferase